MDRANVRWPASLWAAVTPPGPELPELVGIDSELREVLTNTVQHEDPSLRVSIEVAIVVAGTDYEMNGFLFHMTSIRRVT